MCRPGRRTGSEIRRTRSSRPSAGRLPRSARRHPTVLTLLRVSSRLKRLAERNPVGLAIGGAAVGFIAGLLAPSTRMEDERIGPMADDVKATAAEAGREALDRGKDVVQEAGSAAIETAKERGREEGEELIREPPGEGSGSGPRRRRRQPLCHRLPAARASKTAVTSHGLRGRHDQHRRPLRPWEMVRRGRSDRCPALPPVRERTHSSFASSSELGMLRSGASPPD